MGIFSKNKKTSRPVIDKTFYSNLSKEMPDLRSREYKIFRKNERRKNNWYENLCSLSSRFLTLSPDKRTSERMAAAIKFASLRVTPEKVMSLFIISIFFFILVGVVLMATGAIPIMGGLLIAAAGFPIGYFFYKYPESAMKKLRIEASSQVVIVILYMVVSMRISPNLERALAFAAKNVSGPLAEDIRRLLWDIEMRKYSSADEAMNYYIEKWKPENEEFSEALRLIKDSESEAVQKSKVILDQALDTILEGTKTRMKHYVQELRLPVMVIHMMGIVLPILGSIMAPMAAVFLSNVISMWHFIIGYNIALPLILIIFISTTLNKRPVTFSQVNISHHPSVPRSGNFFLGKKEIPAFPISLLILLAFLIPSIMFFANNPSILTSGIADREITANSILMSLLVIMGVGISLASYFILTNYQRDGIKRDIQKTESEFELALFQLGHKISGGTPTELAIEKSIGDMKDLKISDLFQRVLNNIRNLGMTLDNALFDRDYGALKYYPSELIRNIMYTIIDTSKKGVAYASDTMLRIAKYLRNIRETQEYIRDLLEETSSSMKFQAYMLTPLITGLVVSISDVIVQVMSRLGGYIRGIGISQDMGFGDVTKIFGDMDSAISPEIFQFIVGTYLIQVVIILGYFLTKISQGDDKTAQWFLTGKMLIISLSFYFIVALVSTTIFGDLIRSALSNLGVV